MHTVRIYTDICVYICVSVCTMCMSGAPGCQKMMSCGCWKLNPGPFAKAASALTTLATFSSPVTGTPRIEYLKPLTSIKVKGNVKEHWIFFSSVQTRLLCIALAVLELTMETRRASNLQRSTCLWPLSTGISMCYHCLAEHWILTADNKTGYTVSLSLKKLICIQS